MKSIWQLILFLSLRRVKSFSSFHSRLQESISSSQRSAIFNSPAMKLPILYLSNDSSDRTSTISPLDSIQNSFGFQRDKFKQAQADGFGTKARNAAINATVGDILVPLCSNLEMRQTLANQGIYAGVEYKICSLQLQTTIGGEEKAEDIQSLKGIDYQAKQGALAMVQPAYPLRKHLERDDWPVQVKLEDVPLWLSKATYEAGTAVGTLFFSSSLLFFAALIAFFVRFVAVPTASMVPALNPGNIILVTRSIPIVLNPKVGDVVFFDSPTELDVAVAKFASEQKEENTDAVTTTKGKQFLKRVVAVPGESVGVKRSEPFVKLSDTKFRFDVIGPYARPDVFDSSSWDRTPLKLAKTEYFVAGDNGFRSVDSRVWGPLKEKYIIGTAKGVLWPINDFGPIKPGQIAEVTKQQTPDTN